LVTTTSSGLDLRVADLEKRVAEAEAKLADLLSDAELQRRVNLLAELVDASGRPNISSSLWHIARDITAAHLSIKFFGYDLATKLAAALPPRDNPQPRQVGLSCKPSTQADMESDWAAYWCAQYKIPVVFARKIWEFCYVSQALYERGFLNEGTRGLGFGCGVEPLASHFASRGISVLATDAPPSENSSKWAQTNQYTSGLDQLFKPNLVDRKTFDHHVEHRFVDMNFIPAELNSFDFCWSICALEHLGSISKGLDFIENSLPTLRPGGLSVHTTEFNFFDDQKTIDNWGTVFFQRKHFLELSERLTAKGHRVAPLDFNIGNKPMDRFIDVPPYADKWGKAAVDYWVGAPHHLKLTWNGFLTTCFGIIIEKAS
jgi:2-polyprenyl-3-methyl-5-hydroxy-6-metoxy-1,4-benzoquinol methylase